jgi:hypothetical protein
MKKSITFYGWDRSGRHHLVTTGMHDTMEAAERELAEWAKRKDVDLDAFPKRNFN